MILSLFGARAPERIPIFPLQAVLFPGGLLPLRIFETRYMDMAKDCLKNGTPQLAGKLLHKDLEVRETSRA